MAKYNTLTRHGSMIALVATSVLASPAQARTDVSPYLEVGQISTADLKNGGDVLTYSTVAAGVDASISGPRAEVQANYRYERRFAWQNDVADETVHTGILRARLDVAPELLSIEAGALATRVRTDIRGEAAPLLVGNVSNTSQLFSVYAGPSLATSIGALDVAAAYRVGYTKVEANDGLILPVGQPELDQFDDSVSHFATASVGMQPGTLPFGWSVSGAYEREDASQLDQRFEGKNVRGDVTFPITRTVALVGGVGYEDVQISQRPVLLDPTGGPVVDGNGRFVTDATAGRQLAYEFDGLYWDAGVLWQPSSRTSLEARAGRRYGSMTYFGTFSWQATQNSGLQLAVYDEFQTFGQQLSDNLSRLPTSFTVPRNALANNLNGCVFGGAGSGGCLNDALGAISTSAYRSRGLALLWSTTRGRFNAGLGGGYTQRKFVAPTQAGVFSTNGVKDEMWYAQGNVGYALSPRTDFTGDVYVTLFDPGIVGAGNVTSVGGTGALTHRFTRKLDANATLGLYSTRVEGVTSDLVASAFAGLRYSF